MAILGGRLFVLNGKSSCYLCVMTKNSNYSHTHQYVTDLALKNNYHNNNSVIMFHGDRLAFHPLELAKY
jgi:hypothetical protein